MPATLFTRDDTLLGICQGWGEDLGIRPNILRIALGTVVLFSPAMMLGLYLAMGAVLMLTRWAFPVRGAPEVPVEPAMPESVTPAPVELPLAA